MIQDIPKLYTAIAEWGVCLFFVIMLEKRRSTGQIIGLLAAFLPILCVLQYYIGVWPVIFWIPAMIVAMILMYLCIYLCCDVSYADAGFCWAIAFITAEFAASLEWQLYTFAAGKGYDHIVFRHGFMLIIYTVLYTLFYYIECRYLRGDETRGVSVRELVASIIMTISAFLLSNISYVYPDTPFSSGMSEGVFYVRTLVDLSGVLILISQQDRLRESRLRQELEATSMILNRQYEQYQQSKQNIETLNRKYHDLKHQIGVIRQETDADKKEEYLQEMETSIRMYEAENKTGNSVLDTILTGKSLYCVQHEINMTCVADGNLLFFMNVMDICSIFGNALDNAIESVEKLEDKSRKIIRVAVYSQNQFLVIRFENYCESEMYTEGELPVTTKKDKAYHGYGLKSIQISVAKYGGTMTVQTEDHWFYLRLLIPLPKKK